ncbi:hypothetical protein WG66_007739 [Moniliophthora roreri]|nr:hypothetical protein WG66_007739 [Moniliophthora roreri]
MHDLKLKIVNISLEMMGILPQMRAQLPYNVFHKLYTVTEAIYHLQHDLGGGLERNRQNLCMSTDWLGWWNYRINWLSARGMKECCGADVLGEVEEGLDTLRFAVATPIIVLRRPT